AMPEYASIDSVTLRLFLTNTATNFTGETPFTVVVNPIATANADWVEGTGLADGAASQNVGATWNHKNRAGSVNWAGGSGTPETGGLLSAGTDHEVTTRASHTFVSETIPADGTPIDFVF